MQFLRISCFNILLLLVNFFTASRSNAQDILFKFQTSKEKTKHYQTVVIHLYPQEAPQTVANFLTLVKKGFYKGLSIHRVIPSMLVQLGDPLSRDTHRFRSGVGTSGPGYTLLAEIHRKHTRGAVAMAALPETINPSKRSNGSQFYILLKSDPSLDGKDTVFGQVTFGLEFLDAISRRPRDTNDYPLDVVKVQSVSILK